MDHICSLEAVEVAITRHTNLLSNALISKSSLENHKPFKIHKGEPDKREENTGESLWGLPKGKGKNAAFARSLKDLPWELHEEFQNNRGVVGDIHNMLRDYQRGGLHSALLDRRQLEHATSGPLWLISLLYRGRLPEQGDGLPGKHVWLRLHTVGRLQSGVFLRVAVHGAHSQLHRLHGAFLLLQYRYCLQDVRLDAAALWWVIQATWKPPWWPCPCCSLLLHSDTLHKSTIFCLIYTHWLFGVCGYACENDFESSCNCSLFIDGGHQHVICSVSVIHKDLLCRALWSAFSGDNNCVWELLLWESQQPAYQCGLIIASRPAT